MKGDEDLVTARVLARVLDVSVDTIWRHSGEKGIPYLELGSGRYRYSVCEVSRALSRIGETRARWGETVFLP